MGPGRRGPPQNNHNRLGGDELDWLLHDLRGPLTVVYGCTQLLQRDISHGRIHGLPHMIDRLNHIERAAKAIEARLRQLEDQRRRP